MDRVVQIGIVGLCALVATPALAQEDDAPTPFRGTSVSVRSEVSALTFAPDIEPDYNPTVGLNLDLALMWWFDDVFHVRAAGSLGRELTRSDVTTDDGEIVPGDVFFRFGASRLWTVPVLEIDVSTNLDLQAPTSPISRARTLRVGATPGLSLRRSFDVFSGLSIGYGARASFFAHETTTSERQTPLIQDCTVSTGACEPFLNLGLRNVQTRLSNSFDVSLSPMPGLSLGVSTTVLTDFLYDVSEDDRVSLRPEDPAGARFAIVYGLAASWRATPALSLQFGTSTGHAQQAPDGSFRRPFFNRNTVLFMALGLDIAGLTSQLSGE